MTALSFHEVRMSARLAYGSTLGLEHQTEIAQMASGFEQRNNRWAHAKRKYNLAAGPRPMSELVNLLTFFEARGGRLYGFRWQDQFDFKSGSLTAQVTALDQSCRAIDSGGQDFQLQKLYQSGTSTVIRDIHKPVASTVTVAVDGSVLRPNAFTLNSINGTFRLNTAVTDTARVTAGYEFDVPVRFDVDVLEIEYTSADTGRINAIPLLELK